MIEDKKSTDLLGIAPFGEALKIVAEKGADTAQQFLFEICKPAAAEFGLFFRDNVRAWRAKNLMNIANKARELVTINADGVQLRAHPRIVAEIIESGSWCDDEELQKMWAGLLASSCSDEGRDESNLLFTDLLKRLTSPEAHLLRHVCSWWGREGGSTLYGLTHDEITEITGLRGDTVIEYHLGHFESLGLIDGSYTVKLKGGDRSLPNVKPEMLALHLFVRCEGWRGTPEDFFKSRS